MSRKKKPSHLFDWANSPFATVVVTFVFAVYFKDAIVGDEVRATALWGYALAASALAVAIIGPIVGSAADAGARRKPWLFGCSAIMVVACAALWFATPDAGSVWLVLLLVGIGNLGFELGMVFYNAMLPGLADNGRMGRLSGWAWGLGERALENRSRIWRRRFRSRWSALPESLPPPL